MTTGKIEVAKRSKSGKTLGVKIRGKWYSTDLWELQQMVGETITITEENTVPMPDGGTLTYLNAYEPGAVAASAARETNQGRPDSNDNYTENVLLLRFVGNCFAGYPFQTTDEAMVRSRARMLYKMGKEILSGDIEKQETARRTEGQPISRRIEGVHDTPLVPEKQPEDDFDTDDIPF
jgi:hypothetical protein